MAEEPKDQTDVYDQKHGNPSKEPQDRGATEEQKWGGGQNPVRETPLAGSNLKSVGG
jgi:hypothetical protein